eukprot:14411414-Alexandrium_andersonii.AAC.1
MSPARARAALSIGCGCRLTNGISSAPEGHGRSPSSEVARCLTKWGGDPRNDFTDMSSSADAVFSR